MVSGGHSLLSTFGVWSLTCLSPYPCLGGRCYFPIYIRGEAPKDYVPCPRSRVCDELECLAPKLTSHFSEMPSRKPEGRENFFERNKTDFKLISQFVFALF